MEHLRKTHSAPCSFDPPVVSVDARDDGPRLALDLHGEADRYSAGQLLDELLSTLRPDVQLVRVDLTDLSFCDLAGSDALHAFVDEAGNRGIPVELHGMSALLDLIYTTYPSRLRRPAESDPRRGPSGPAEDRHPVDA